MEEVGTLENWGFLAFFMTASLSELELSRRVVILEKRSETGSENGETNSLFFCLLKIGHQTLQTDSAAHGENPIFQSEK